MNDEHHTEVDGLVATWRVTTEPNRIQIMNVHNTSDDQDIDVNFDPGTDLAEARERRPKWDRLWDMVRCEFWSEFTPSSRRNPGGYTMRWLG